VREFQTHEFLHVPDPLIQDLTHESAFGEKAAAGGKQNKAIHPMYLFSNLYLKSGDDPSLEGRRLWK
jgi:hypothetical protein